ncbi:MULTISPECIES: hypothetical protein [Streptomyces]|uniref:hypothetical protein n=1 Tax=Streptomyces TaxID=1883 RepID=UPI000696B57A|nr:MULTISPECIES: hypothetical protein [unclassified Streptomyces]
MALDDPHRSSGDRPEPVDTVKAPASVLHEAELRAGPEILPCGRPVSRAWEQARRPAGAPVDPHTGTCTWCRQAVEGLTALDRAARALRTEEQPDGRTLAQRVVDAVRAETRLGAMLLLDDPDQDLHIAESAAAKVLRRAVDTVPGARAISCRLVLVRGSRAVHTVALTIAAALDQPLPERAEEVRGAVLHAAHRGLGLRVTAVDLTINAVLEAPRATVDERSTGGDL